jgi:hypothetical protein
MTPAELFAQMTAKFNALYLWVSKTHADILAAGKNNHGHGLDHDLMVAQYAALIAENPRVGEMAWCTGLMHSTDRHFSGDQERELIDEYCSLLPEKYFSEEETVWIREAVYQHSRLNSSDDNPVTVTLKDADRLANIGAR